MRKPQNHILVIFGASGDLTKRKLIPALADLFEQNLLPEKFAVLGLGRTKLTEVQFRKNMLEGIKDYSSKKGDKAKHFAKQLHYYSFNTKNKAEYAGFREKLEELNPNEETHNNYIFYLATPPSMYSLIPEFLNDQKLNEQKNGFRRLIIEKPFGHNLESAKKLNKDLLKYFNEEQIYRIDHYLGKETVQNLLVTRFSNSIFESLWNRNFIHHIEITSSEDIGVGNRGSYYEESGAMRDMVQNHLLLIASLVAMEPPTQIYAENIRNEIVKVLQSLRPIPKERIEDYVIRGQYTESVMRSKKAKGYRQEKGVDAKSRTETFVAVKFFIDNWRWADVPFYIRTGKMLPTRVTEIVIHFKPTPHHLFPDGSDSPGKQNQLVIRIQPDEGILLKFGMKVPGAGFRVQDVNMDFHYSELNDTYLPSAYERLLLDCMLGDPTLYSRGDAVEAAWEFTEPILQAWKENPDIKIHGYPAGTWGPDVSDQLIEGSMTWRYPCKNLSDGLFCEL
jgi:glucose-6-phosphate 1-dehydrogenase